MEQKKKLTIRQKQRIYDLYVKEGRSVKAIADTFETTTATVYNIIGDRVKKKKSPRADKGKERVGYGMKLTKEQQSRLEAASENESDSDNIASTLEIHALNLLTKADKIRNTQIRARILEAVSRILKRVATHKLESHIKKADATIVSMIVRRYEPNATDEHIIKVWRETAEKLRMQS